MEVCAISACRFSLMMRITHNLTLEHKTSGVILSTMHGQYTIQVHSLFWSLEKSTFET